MGRIARIVIAGLGALAFAALLGCSNPVLDVIAKQYDEAGGFEPVFSASAESFLVTDSVTFTNGTIAEVKKLHWDFGDGTSVDDTAAPSHKYTDKGIYTVTLTATSSHGTVRTYSMSVYAMGTEPTVVLVSPAKDAWVTGNPTPITVTVVDKFSSSGNANFIGVKTITVSITDSAAVTHDQTYTLTSAEDLQSQKSGFVYTFDWNTTAEADGSASIVVTAKDGDDETATWTPASPLPVKIDNSVPDLSMSVDGGNQYNTTGTATLGLTYNDSVSGVAQMRFSNDNATWSSWETAATARSWQLAGGADGSRTVYAQVRDTAGVSSAPAFDSISLETTPPSVSSFTINSGGYTKSVTVTLNCAATDPGSGVTSMSFANSSSGPWTTVAYATTYPWSIGSGDGAHRVWAKFTDGYGRESAARTADITLDATAPDSPSISINGGATWATSAAVSLGPISASDATSGLSEMCFSENGSTWGSWQAFSSSASYTITAGDGTNRPVYVKFRDHALNESLSAYDTINLDTTAPGTPTVSINSGASYTTSLAVTLGSISSSDATSGLSQMSFSQDGTTWSSWQSFATSVSSYTLTGSDSASKTVYVRVRDVAGNVSLSGSDAICLDRANPVISQFVINDGNSATSSPNVTLTTAVTDATSGVAQCRFSNNGTIWSDWYPASGGTRTDAWTLASVDGTSTVYCQVSDAAGNTTAAQDTIVADVAAPLVSGFRINEGAATTPSTSVTVSATVTDVSAVTVELSEDGYSWTSYGTWTGASMSYTLSAGDGNRTVYGRFTDAAGNPSSTYSDTIVLDAGAPVVSNFLINTGDARASSRNVTVTANVSDASSVTVELSENGSTWTSFGTWTGASLSWTFSAGDGSRTLYGRFIDASGHMSAASDTILLDADPPVVSGFLANTGAAVAASTDVTVTATVSDASTVTYELSENGSSWTSYGTWTGASATFTLSAGDGSRTVYGRFTDASGHMTTSSDDITLDAAAPVVASFQINSGMGTTNTSAVSLQASVSDATSMTMRFSNDYVTWSSWESYASTKSWQLSAGKGSKTVWAEFMDSSSHVQQTQAMISYMPTYDTLTRADIVAAEMSMTSSPFTPNAGLYYLFRTDSGFYGKMQIIDASFDLKISETVYDPNGLLYYMNPSVLVSDGQTWDLDLGTTGGSDFMWSSMMLQSIGAVFCNGTL